MRVWTGMIAALAAWCAAAAVVVAQTAPSASADGPTIDDAKAALDAGDYREALERTGRVLNRDEATLTDADRFQLLMIRGKAMTARQVWDAAERTFDQAVELAPTEADRIRAMANRSLLRFARGGTLDVGGPGGDQRIDLSDLGQHDRAARVLLDGQLRDLRPKVDQAAGARNLVPILDLLPRVIDLYALEMASTGKSEQTDLLFTKLGDRAHELMTDEVRAVGRRVGGIRSTANNLVTRGQYVNPSGVTTRQKDALREDGRYLERISAAARQARQIATQIGRDAGRWDQVVLRAEEIADTAAGLLERGY